MNEDFIFTYSKDDHSLILKQYVGPGGDVVVPEGVVVIGCEAFKNRADVTSVTLPDSVLEIGKSAFWRCTNLKHIRLPIHLDYIDKFAFRYCESLTQLDFPNTVSHFGKSVFFGCRSLSFLRLPACVSEIPENCFSTLKQLKTLVIAGPVRQIPKNAFAGLTKLTKVTLPDTVQTIGQGAFSSCWQLQEVQLPKHLISLEARTFVNCPNLKRLMLPETLQQISRTAFVQCPKLTLSVFTNSYGDYFAQATNIPFVREGEARLENQLLTELCIANDVLVSFRSYETRLVVPEGVRELGPRALTYCPFLKELVLPYSLTAIADDAFGGTDLRSLNIHIPQYSTCARLLKEWKRNHGYYYWPTLVEIEPPEMKGSFVLCDGTLVACKPDFMSQIPDGTTKIARTAFLEVKDELCSDLRIPNTVTYIDPEAFDVFVKKNPLLGAPQELRFPSFIVDEGSYAETFLQEHFPLSKVTLRRILKNETGAFLVQGETLLKCWHDGPVVRVPEEVSVLSPYCFCYDKNLQSVTLPEGLQFIHSHAFEGCGSLTSVNLPRDLKMVGNHVFKDCPKLSFITRAQFWWANFTRQI